MSQKLSELVGCNDPSARIQVDSKCVARCLDYNPRKGEPSPSQQPEVIGTVVENCAGCALLTCNSNVPGALSHSLHRLNINRILVQTDNTP